MELNKTQIEQQKKRRRILIIVLAAAAVVLAAALALRSWIRMPDVPDTPVQPPAQGDDVTVTKPTTGRRQGVYTFLVAGRDVASGSTDTMLLLTYDTQAKTIHGLNLPRDTMMNVEFYNKRLNAIYAFSKGSDRATQVEKGMTALKEAVADLTGITPDFYVLVEWEAIGELVDAIGGVEFEVPFDMKYDDIYQDPPLHIDQKAGLRTLTGEDAMEVIRWRQNNGGVGGGGGDIARLSIQQDFLKAVVKKCLQPATLLKINSLVEIFKNNVETDLTVGNILAFAEQAIGMDPSTGVEFVTAPVADSFRYQGMALITLDPEGVLEIVNSKMNPNYEQIKVEDLEMLVRGADRYFTVTGGTLDPSVNAGVNTTVSQPAPEPEPEPEPEEPVEPEQPAEGEVTDPETGEVVEGEPATPEDPAEGEVPGEGEIPGEGELVVDPEQPAPDPEEPVEEPVSQDIPSQDVQEEEPPVPDVTEEDPVAILPSRPVPVERAA